MKTSLILYIVVSIFPGCLYSHMLRLISLIPNPLGFVGGIPLLLLFNTLLALFLLYVFRSKEKIKTSKLSFTEVTIFAIFVVCLILYAKSTNDLTELSRASTNDYYLEGMYGRHFVAAWLVCFTFGLFILLSAVKIGVYFASKLNPSRDNLNSK